MGHDFRFKQFALTHQRCAMKIGTDGVLLGAWAQLPQASGTALDVGAGCGLIALMLAQRYPQARVTAVELDTDAAEDLRVNVDASPWSDRVDVVQSDFTTVEGCYDLIVSNPPFFITGERSPQSARAAARHVDHGLSPISLVAYAAAHLSKCGRVALIFPIEQLSEVEFQAAMHRLNPLRITEVASTATRPPMRVLAEFSSIEAVCERSRLDIHTADGGYTPDYVSLTKDFYLHL